MRSIDDLMIDAALVVVVGVGGWFYASHNAAEHYREGYAAAVAAGQVQREHDTAINRETETHWRTLLAARDAEAYRKDKEHAQALADAQRRMRAGTDRLLCPAANPVHEATATSAGPAAAEPGVDGARPAIVPQTAADLLGIAGDVAGLVSRYQQVVDRFEACRAVNAK